MIRHGRMEEYMNLPNKLTILRTILIPFFLIFIYTDFWGKEMLI